jgi:anaerobic selenocysteine-containing dehydrogenase
VPSPAARFNRHVNFNYLLESAFTPGSNVRPDVQGILGDWPCEVLPPEIEAGNIRALFNFGGALLRSFPDTNALRAALPKLALHVSTEVVHNELSPFCTHVLPTKDAVERDEFTRWDTLDWNLSLQYTPALEHPMGERRSAWWVISRFMRRAGLSVSDHVPEDDYSVPGAGELMLAKLLEYGRCSFEELKAEQYVEFPLGFPAEWHHADRAPDHRYAAGRGVDSARASRCQCQLFDQHGCDRPARRRGAVQWSADPPRSRGSIAGGR